MPQTEFEFTLPVGYTDQDGVVHRQGVMRMATAMDEIAPLRDPRVHANQAYLAIVLLARVIVKLGALAAINTGVIEGLYVADLAYLQALYRRINEEGKSLIALTCPECKASIEVDLATLGGIVGYPLDRLHEEVAYLAYYFHWPLNELLALEHAERQRWVEELVTINRRLNEAAQR